MKPPWPPKLILPQKVTLNIHSNMYFKSALLSNSFQVNMRLCQNPCPALSKPENCRKLLRSSGVSRSKRALWHTAVTASDPQSRHSPVPLRPALSTNRAAGRVGWWVGGEEKKEWKLPLLSCTFPPRGDAWCERGRVGKRWRRRCACWRRRCVARFPAASHPLAVRSFQQQSPRCALLLTSHLKGERLISSWCQCKHAHARAQYTQARSDPLYGVLKRIH